MYIRLLREGEGHRRAVQLVQVTRGAQSQSTQVEEVQWMPSTPPCGVDLVILPRQSVFPYRGAGHPNLTLLVQAIIDEVPCR